MSKVRGTINLPDVPVGNVYTDDGTFSPPTGGEVSLANTYSNSLSAAILAIGSTPTTLLIDADTTLTTSEIVPATLNFEFKNAAQIIDGGGGELDFQGIPFSNMESTEPIFSGFSAGDIVFSGATFPERLSSSLWADAVLSTRLNSAIEAVAGHDVTIVAYPGDIAAQVVLTDGLGLHLTRGTYTSSLTGAFNIPILPADNTRVYGDGQGQTFITENADSARIIYASGATGSAAGTDSNIIVEHITFLGNPSTAVDSASSTVFLGNITNGFVRHCTFDRTHGFAAYIGGDSQTNGYLAQNAYFTDNVCIGLQTQNMGTVGGRNVFISRNLFKISPGTGTPAFIAVVDIEPNANSDGSDNIQITENIFDGRLADSGWNGITVQRGFGAVMRNVRVADNLIIGMNDTVAAFMDTNINPTTDRITVYGHGYDTGQSITLVRDDSGNGGSLPGGFGGGGSYAGWIIKVDQNTVKIASSYANALAGTAVDITDTGVAGGGYLLVPSRLLGTAIQIFTVEASVVENNFIIGAGGKGVDIQSAHKLTLRNNTLIGVAGGGNDAITLLDVSNSDIVDNNIQRTSQALSQSEVLTETDGTLTVSTTAGSPIVTTTSASILPWWLRNQTITINAVDYVVYQVNGTGLVLTTNAVSNLSDVTATLHSSSNRYRGNRIRGGIALSPTGTSRILSDYMRVVADSYAPAQITANQNDYNPGRNAYRLDLSTDALRNLTGLVFTDLAQVDGEKHLIYNAGSQNIVLKHEDTGSAAANRFKNSTETTINLAPGQAAELEYIGGSVDRWAVFKRDTATDSSIYDFSAGTTTTGTSPEVLHTGSIPAAKFSKIGDEVRVVYRVEYAANTNDKQIAIDVNGTEVFGPSAFKTNGTAGRLEVELMRIDDSDLISVHATYIDPENVATNNVLLTSVDFNSAIPVVFTAFTPSASGDITLHTGKAIFIPAS